MPETEPVKDEGLKGSESKRRRYLIARVDELLRNWRGRGRRVKNCIITEVFDSEIVDTPEARDRYAKKQTLKGDMRGPAAAVYHYCQSKGLHPMVIQAPEPVDEAPHPIIVISYAPKKAKK